MHDRALDRVVVIACGNTLRSDDGVAHRVLEVLAVGANVERRATMQLVPELAADIASADTVVFIDAELREGDVCVEALEAATRSPPRAMTHIASPAGIVAQSRSLFGFAGRAYLCRIPVSDLTLREGLTPAGRAAARRAAAMLEQLLG